MPPAEPTAIPLALPVASHRRLARAAGGARSERNSVERTVLRLFDDYRRPVTRYVLSLGLSPADAEDVAQEVFLALFNHLQGHLQGSLQGQLQAHLDRPRVDDNLPGWLFRVARNLCLDQLRRRKFKLSLFRDLQKDEDQPFVPGDADAVRPDQIAETREANAAIEHAIGELPMKFREAFLLCEVEGLSYEDAAAVMGCPVKTVSTRLFRARQRFKSLVSRLIKV